VKDRRSKCRRRHCLSQARAPQHSRTRARNFLQLLVLGIRMRAKRPFLSTPQTCLKPRNSKVSGLSPCLPSIAAAKRPKSSSRVLSSASSRLNFAKRSRNWRWNFCKFQNDGQKTLKESRRRNVFRTRISPNYRQKGVARACSPPPSTDSTPAETTDAGSGVGNGGGTGLATRPQGTPASGGDGAGGSPHYLSGVAERKRDEARALVRLHPKQQRVLALLTRLRDLPADVCGA
jgi:hypothetical protein